MSAPARDRTINAMIRALNATTQDQPSNATTRAPSPATREAVRGQLPRGDRPINPATDTLGQPQAATT